MMTNTGLLPFAVDRKQKTGRRKEEGKKQRE
jgi:hypothetical protein